MEGAAFSSGTSRRSFPTLPVDFKHSSNTSHTFFVHLLRFYCSNAAGKKKNILPFFFFLSQRTTERKKELFSSSYSMRSYLTSKSTEQQYSHANTSVPLYGAQIRKTATLHHRPRTMSAKTRAIARAHQTKTETAQREKLSVKNV